MIILCNVLPDWFRQSHDRVNKMSCLPGIDNLFHLIGNLEFFMSMVYVLKAEMGILCKLLLIQL